MRLAQKITLIILTILGILLVGLRDDTGMDWVSYLMIYDGIIDHKISPFPAFSIFNGTIEIFSIEPGYWLLNRLVQVFDGGIYVVNFICASIIFGCTYIFCKQQRYPLLSFVCLSFITLFISMNHTRQVVSFAINLVALTYLAKKDHIKFFILVLLSATIHYSAVLILMLLKAEQSGVKFYRSKYFQYGAIIVAAILCMTFINKVLLYFVAWNVRDYFPANYINYFLNFLAILIFFRCKEQFQKTIPEWYRILDIACKLTAVVLVMCVISPIGSSRILYYFNFIQPLVLAGFVSIIPSRQAKLTYISLLLVVYGIQMYILFGNVFKGIVFEYSNILLK